MKLIPIALGAVTRSDCFGYCSWTLPLDISLLMNHHSSVCQMAWVSDKNRVTRNCQSCLAAPMTTQPFNRWLHSGKLTWQLNMDPEWGCISYWKWWYSIAMLVQQMAKQRPYLRIRFRPRFRARLWLWHHRRTAPRAHVGGRTWDISTVGWCKSLIAS